MKITDVETVVVTVPLVAPIRVSQGVASGTIVKIHTYEKQVGSRRMSLHHRFRPSSSGLVAILSRVVAMWVYRLSFVPTPLSMAFSYAR
jgi:acyl-CoA thioesterase FadM